MQAGGINPVYMDMAELNASMHQPQPTGTAATRKRGPRGGGAARPRGFSTPLSVSMLAVVEEAVSAAATVFLGTAESSMTGMIVQVRGWVGGSEAQGMTRHNSNGVPGPFRARGRRRSTCNQANTHTLVLSLLYL